MKNIFQISYISESENIFNFSVDIKKALKIGFNFDKNWVRDGSLIDNPKDNSKLCGCEYTKSAVVSRKSEFEIETTSIENDDDGCKPKDKTSYTRFCNLEYTFYNRCPDSECYLTYKDINSKNHGLIVGITVVIVIIIIIIIFLEKQIKKSSLDSPE